MRRFLFAATCAIAAMVCVASWVAASAMAEDELPAPGEVRLFWQMEPLKSPPGVPDDGLGWRRIGEIVPMSDGGVLVSVYRGVRSDFWPDTHIYFVRLASDGTERWRVDYRLCADDAPGCGNWRLIHTRIAPTADGGFIVLLGSKRIDRYDSRGVFMESQPVSRCQFQHYDRVAAREGTFYFAGNCELWDDDTPGGALVRWEPECHGCWRIRLPLHADNRWQYGHGLDLDFLADGTLLWTIYGSPPMNLDPAGRWQVRVTPTGQILPPGPLETSLQSDRGQWQFFGNALLPDGRLIRLGRYDGRANDNKVRLEFWDGSGSQRLGWRILDFGRDAGLDYDGIVYRPELFYLNTRGRSAFYLASYNDRDLQIAGFDAAGEVEWQATISVDGRYAVGDGMSGRVYIAAPFESGPERRTAPAIYLTSVE